MNFAKVTSVQSLELQVSKRRRIASLIAVNGW